MNPDLVSVTKDGDQIIFEFDEPNIRKRDPVESSQALQFFDKKANVYHSKAVQVLGTYTIGAIYALPEGDTIADAVRE